MPRPQTCERTSQNRRINSGIPPEDLETEKVRSSLVLSWLKVIPRRRVCCHPEPKIPCAAGRVRFEPVAEDKICSARQDQDMHFASLVRELDRITNLFSR